MECQYCNKYIPYDADETTQKKFLLYCLKQCFDYPSKSFRFPIEDLIIPVLHNISKAVAVIEKYTAESCVLTDDEEKEMRHRLIAF